MRGGGSYCNASPSRDGDSEPQPQAERSDWGVGFDTAHTTTKRRDALRPSPRSTRETVEDPVNSSPFSDRRLK
jgi:hypothetical protein